MKLLRGLSRIYFDPIRIIECILAFFTLMGGLYIISPLYENSVAKNGVTSFASALNHEYIVVLWGASLAVFSFLAIFGIYNRLPQLKSIGWFGIGLVRMFQSLTILFTSGMAPLSWAYPMTISFIAFVLWANARVETVSRHARR